MKTLIGLLAAILLVPVLGALWVGLLLMTWLAAVLREGLPRD